MPKPVNPCDARFSTTLEGVVDGIDVLHVLLDLENGVW